MELRTLGLGCFDLYVHTSPLQRLPHQIRMYHRTERGFMTNSRPDGSPEPRQWHFRRMGKAEMNDDPIQGEFFTNQDIADRLVRETLQNSLGCSHRQWPSCSAIRPLGTAALKIRLDWGSTSEGCGRIWRKLFDSNAPGREELSNLTGRSGIPYLLIEDFKTKGLTGDIEQFQDLSSGEFSDDNHFYWFVRNVGRSGKRGLEGGSWGVGKYVFPDASKINTFFFLTHRSDDSRSILMGQSVLKMHILEGIDAIRMGIMQTLRRRTSLFQLSISRELRLSRMTSA